MILPLCETASALFAFSGLLEGSLLQRHVFLILSTLFLSQQGAVLLPEKGSVSSQFLQRQSATCVNNMLLYEFS